MHGVDSGAAAGAGSLHILVQRDELRIVLSGEIDASLTGEFNAAMNEATSSALPVTFDLRHVTFMDSFGVAFVSKIALAAPARPRLLHVPPTVKFLLEVTSTADLVEIVE
ncbi:anti-anti-sigma factor [Rarobacter incanus]|uniref:Anti-anti-sigma factor n=2 Tax=Rarobacter incanus TaxID=153494 RepID=A0A542SQF4_9MICO|nr:anti-anti-sigma factor [Rarobacter incanus]